MRSEVAIVGVGRTPYSRAKPGEPVRTVDEYLAWAADLALQQAGMSKNDFDGQGLGVAHAEVAHTVNWSAAVAETLGISPKVLLRADQGGASASSLLIRAAAMIKGWMAASRSKTSTASPGAFFEKASATLLAALLWPSPKPAVRTQITRHSSQKK